MDSSLFEEMPPPYSFITNITTTIMTNTKNFSNDNNSNQFEGWSNTDIFRCVIPQLMSQVEKEGWKTHTWEAICDELLYNDFLKPGDIEAEFVALSVYEDYAQQFQKVDILTRNFEFDEEYFKQQEREFARTWTDKGRTALSLLLVLFTKFYLVTTFFS